MGTRNDYGGLTSVTGSLGGGGDGSRHDDDRGIFFPEFNKWARQNGMILKITTRAKADKNGVSETITLDVDFDDGAWRPASTIIGNQFFPKRGEDHPTIEGCKLDTITIQHQDQHDLFRSTLNYKFPDRERSDSGSISGFGSFTPLDEDFTIDWTPVLSQIPLQEDLAGVAVRNPNGEAYLIERTQVRLDGICNWTQSDWNFEDSEKWSNKINKGAWTEGNYKFKEGTVLVHYVVGNLKYFNDDDGSRVPYYEMSAAISYDSNGIGEGDGKVKVRRQGSYYFQSSSEQRPEDKRPTKRSQFQYDEWDLDSDGVLLSRDSSKPTSSSPQYDLFNVYEPVKFNFVDR